MVQSRRKMVHKWYCGAFLSARGAPRRLGGVHFSSCGASGRRRTGIPSVRSLVSGRRMVQSGGEMVHFSYSGGISSGGTARTSRRRTAGALGEPRTGVRAAGTAVRGPGHRVRALGTAVPTRHIAVRAPPALHAAASGESSGSAPGMPRRLREIPERLAEDVSAGPGDHSRAAKDRDPRARSVILGARRDIRDRRREVFRTSPTGPLHHAWLRRARGAPPCNAWRDRPARSRTR